MFWTINKSFLVTCIVILDVLLLIDIQNNKNSTVVIIEKPKTIQIFQASPAQIGSAKITISKSTKTTETPTPTPGVEPPTQTQSKPQTQIQTPNDSGNLIGQVNAYRASKGLSEVSTDPYTCAFANIRASEITSAFNHDGFSSRVNSKTLPYPSYSEIAENIAMSSNPADVVQAWIDSPGHNENMLKNTPFACIGNSGDYYAYESWTP